MNTDQLYHLSCPSCGVDWWDKDAFPSCCPYCNAIRNWTKYYNQACKVDKERNNEGIGEAEMTVDKITTQQVKIEINNVTLLSEEEYLACKDNISIINNSWWLRSPDYLQCYATYVNNDGSPCFNTVDYDSACIRPALRISNLESSNLKIGDKVFIADYVWTVVANDLILCDNTVMYSCFRNDWHAEDANNYEASDVKKKLEKWAMEHGIIIQEKMKSAYRVMLELSKTWQNLDDALKSIITNLLAETSNNKALRTVDEAIEQIRLMEEILSKAKLDKTN